jgi:hypothetical protein
MAAECRPIYRLLSRCNGRLRPAREQADDRHHVLQASVLDRAFGRLHEQWRGQLFAGVDDCSR